VLRPASTTTYHDPARCAPRKRLARRIQRGLLAAGQPQSARSDNAAM